MKMLQGGDKTKVQSLGQLAKYNKNVRASGDRHTASLINYIGEINNKKFASERN